MRFKKFTVGLLLALTLFSPWLGLRKVQAAEPPQVSAVFQFDICLPLKTLIPDLPFIGNPIYNACEEIMGRSHKAEHPDPQNPDQLFGLGSFLLNGVMGTLIVGLPNILLYGEDPSIPPASYNPRPIKAAPVGLVAMVYQHPPNLGTVSSLAYTLNNNILGIKTAQAATGRERLSPLLGLWSGIRNLAYLLIAVVLVAYGLMVMFRYKIDPRTVVSVESAIPSLVLGLIAITFSYTMASLTVDISQLGLGVVESFLSSINPPGPMPPATCPGPAGHNCYSPWPAFQDPTKIGSSMLIFGAGGINIQAPVLCVTAPGNPGIVCDIINAVPNWMIGFAVWYTFISLFFALIMNYAKILIATILGPLMIAVGMLPGRSGAIRGWALGLITSALVFPGIYFVINIALYINNWGDSLSPGGVMSLPEPISSASSISTFITIGLFMLATKVPAFLEEALGTAQSGGVSRAGVDLGQAMKKTPFVGGLMG